MGNRGKFLDNDRLFVERGSSSFVIRDKKNFFSSWSGEGIDEVEEQSWKTSLSSVSSDNYGGIQERFLIERI